MLSPDCYLNYLHPEQEREGSAWARKETALPVYEDRTLPMTILVSDCWNLAQSYRDITVHHDENIRFRVTVGPGGDRNAVSIDISSGSG
jgi:hypothetical protein